MVGFGKQRGIMCRGALAVIAAVICIPPLCTMVLYITNKPCWSKCSEWPLVAVCVYLHTCPAPTDPSFFVT